ncbi:hypothetical protein ACFOPN_03385 [Xanthomonas hyacinthi]|uniref:hypothetical protein n=1 Tax=Xanthomonas hyacinthi TaxID=56455 RepID=UPI003622794C
MSFCAATCQPTSNAATARHAPPDGGCNRPPRLTLRHAARKPAKVARAVPATAGVQPARAGTTDDTLVMETHPLWKRTCRGACNDPLLAPLPAQRRRSPAGQRRALAPGRHRAARQPATAPRTTA